jgi:ketosteroid isomerase-like protein
MAQLFARNDKLLFMITKYLFSVLLVSLAMNSMAQNDEKQVEAAVESFRKAVVDANGPALKTLISDDVSYGHSDGHVEGKQDLIDKLLDGRYDFVTMDLTEQTVKISGDVAIVRNKLDGQTNDNGKPGEPHLYVLMIWHKAKKGWELLARQAVKQATVVK